MAASGLLADFCGVRRLDGIRGVAKSTLERAAKFFRPDQVRKRVRRQCKPLLRTIAGHARRHRDRLARDFARTDCTAAQADRLLARIDRMLAVVPQVNPSLSERCVQMRQNQR